MSSFLTRCIRLTSLALLMASPFPFGSVQPQAIFVIEAAVALLLLIWAAEGIRRGTCEVVPLRLLWPLVALIAWCALSLVPLPAAVLQSVSPETARLYAAVGAHASQGAAGRLSLAPFESSYELLRYAACAGLFLVLIHAFREGRWLLVLCTTLVTSATAVALLGIVQGLWWGNRIYGTFDPGSGSPFGPFVNHNHFAGYIELGVGIALGLLVAEIQRYRRHTGRLQPNGFYSWLWMLEGSRAWLLLAASLIMLAALGLSLSRGGALSFAATATLFCLGGLLSTARCGSRSGRAARIALLALAVTAAGTVALLAATPRGRARWSAGYDSAARYRLEVWKDTLRGIADFPWTGTGPGSFRSVFPRYKSGSFHSETTHAENEYLQWALETGVAGVVLGGALLLSFLHQTVWALRRRRDPYVRPLAWGALFSLTCLLLHNAVDFNLHIPSNALTFAAVGAVAVLATGYHRGREARFTLPARAVSLRGPGGWALATLAAAAACTLSFFGWTHYQALRAEAEWHTLLRERPPAAVPLDGMAALERATRLAPLWDRGEYLMASARAAAAPAGSLFRFSERRVQLESARSGMIRAIARKPADAVYWSALASIEDRLGDRAASAGAFAEALKLAPTNGFVYRDCAYSLLRDGRIAEGVQHLEQARKYAPGLDLTVLLNALAAYTEDPQALRAIVRYTPEELRIYAGFLEHKGSGSLASEIRGEAERLEGTRLGQ